MKDSKTINKILNEDFIVNLRTTEKVNDNFICSPSEEFGSIRNIRFLTQTENDGKETQCDDCDAHMHLNDLYELDFDDPEVNLIEAMKALQDALVFVLETVEWKVGD